MATFYNDLADEVGQVAPTQVGAQVCLNSLGQLPEPAYGIIDGFKII